MSKAALKSHSLDAITAILGYQLRPCNVFHAIPRSTVCTAAVQLKPQQKRISSKLLQPFQDSTVLVESMSNPVEAYEQVPIEDYLLFMQNGEAISLARAVQCGLDARNLAPERCPDRAARLSNLSVFLSKRYEAEGELDDFS